MADDTTAGSADFDQLVQKLNENPDMFAQQLTAAAGAGGTGNCVTWVYETRSKL